MEQITLVLDNIRSAYNVGAILRSCAAFSVENVVALGITPYPEQPNDPRLPHVSRNAHRSIAKTALGAENIVKVEHYENTHDFLQILSQPLYALEQTTSAQPVHDFRVEPPYSLVVGNEVDGVSPQLLEAAHGHIVIPHSSAKNSLNASVATGVALSTLYHRAQTD